MPWLQKPVSSNHPLSGHQCHALPMPAPCVCFCFCRQRARRSAASGVESWSRRWRSRLMLPRTGQASAKPSGNLRDQPFCLLAASPRLGLQPSCSNQDARWNADAGSPPRQISLLARRLQGLFSARHDWRFSAWVVAPSNTPSASGNMVACSHKPTPESSSLTGPAREPAIDTMDGVAVLVWPCRPFFFCAESLTRPFTLLSAPSLSFSAQPFDLRPRPTAALSVPLSLVILVCAVSVPEPEPEPRAPPILTAEGPLGYVLLSPSTTPRATLQTPVDSRLACPSGKLRRRNFCWPSLTRIAWRSVRRLSPSSLWPSSH